MDGRISLDSTVGQRLQLEKLVHLLCKRAARFLAWNSTKPAFQPIGTAEGDAYPDVFQCFRKTRPHAEIGLVYEWNGIAATVDTNACSYCRQIAGSNAVSVACEYLRDRRPDFLAVCIDSPDHPGHDKGWGSPEYYDKVAELDRGLAEIVRTLEQTGMADESVLIVSSDHGGKNKKHGGATLEEMERPVFIWGKNVKRGHRLSFGGTIYDTGATIAELLGVTPPRAWIGRPFDEAFESD